jgi:salicylate hydroxylase
VLEQAPALTVVGASIELGPNAVRLLADLDLLPALREVGSRPDTVEFVRWDDGRLLLRTPVGQESDDYFGAPLLDFWRPELQDVLVRALPPDILMLDARVVAVDQDDDHAFVTLADGRRLTADAVVAADGIKSDVRRQLIGEDVPEFSGTVVYRGLVPREAVVDIHPEPVNRYWLGPYRHAVSYWISGRKLLSANLAVQQAKWARESWTDSASADEALEYVEGWDKGLRERIARAKTLLRSAVFVRKPPDRWSFGRITLLGDAAHAMQPFAAQGAAQAIEDAIVLAACVEGVDSSGVAGALQRYEQLRTERAADVQESSRTAALSYYLPDGDEQRERDALYATLHDKQPWGHRQALWEHDVRDDLARAAGGVRS